MDSVDVVIVGGGPAGLSAATWVARYRRSVLVLDSGEQRNRWAKVSHGYLGSDSVDPAEMLERARDDLAKYDEVEIRSGRAVSARRDADRFEIGLGDGSTIVCRRVILATGVVDAFPDIPRFFDFYGRSIFHCPSCDGYEARGLPVVTIGWSENVAGFSLGLLDWASDVTVVTDGRRFEGDTEHREALADKGVSVVEDEVVELCGPDGELESIRLRDGGVIPCGMAFFSIEHRPRSDLARQLDSEVTGAGCISVDHEGRTNVPGVYAAGDVTPGMQYVATAVAEGAKAGTACALSLRDEGLGRPDGRHDRPELG